MFLFPDNPRCSVEAHAPLSHPPLSHPQAQLVALEFVKEPKAPGVWGVLGGGPTRLHPPPRGGSPSPEQAPVGSSLPGAVL